MYVYGAGTPDWVRWSQASGNHWYGHRVTIEGDSLAAEYVLGAKKFFYCSVSRKPSGTGANYDEALRK